MEQSLEIWGVLDPNISAQLALAVRLNLFKRDANLDVTCRFIESGTKMAEEVLTAQQKPFAIMQTPMTAIALQEQGYQNKILAPLADIAGTQQVVIHSASGIVHPRDLERKRVGMPKGAAIYLAIDKMARDYGVDMQKIEFVDLLPHDLLPAFFNHQINAIACWQPWTSHAQKDGGRFYFSGSRSAIPGMEGKVNWLVNQSCLIAPDEHVQRHADTLTAILRVLKTATDMLNAQSKEASKELAEFFGVERVEMMKAMSENTYSMAMDNLFRIGVLGFRDFLYETGRLSTKISESSLYDSSLLCQVDPALVTFEELDDQSLSIIEKSGIYYPKGVTLSGDGRPLRFLLADDSKYVRRLLAQTVKIIGGELVGEATTGRDAIEAFTRLRPNVVTMDLSMPDVSGVDAIRHILQLDPDVNIVVISGADLEEVRKEVFELGAKLFITKPFDPMLVAEIIGLLLF